MNIIEILAETLSDMRDCYVMNYDRLMVGNLVYSINNYGI